MPTRFVVISSARSGSTYFCRWLDAHPDITCAEEVFKSDRDFYDGNRHHLPGELLDLKRRNEDPLSFANDVWNAFDDVRAVGFKILTDQNAVVLNAVIRDASVHKIILERENALRQLVSLELARKTGQWVMRSSDTLNKTSVFVNPNEVLAYAQKQERLYGMFRKTLDATSQPYVWITHEELFSRDQNRCFERSCALLNVPMSSAAKPDVIRQHPEPLSELIENFEEVKKALEGTAAKRWLTH